MIDLHIHSNYSDGTENVIDILKKAEELKLNVISITDHENCNSYEEVFNINTKNFFSGEIIPGIELKTGYEGQVVDILGYGIDCSRMKEFLGECYGGVTRAEIQLRQLEEFYEYGYKYGLKLRPVEELEWNKDRDWASITFYNELKRYPENKEKVPEDLWEDWLNFKRNYYNKKGSMFYVDRSKDYPTMDKIIDVIHKSGGKAFVAHVFEYTWMDDKIKELSSIISEFDVDGVECYYSNFTKEQSETLVEFCKNNNLLMSGGSDYHGKNRPHLNIGVGRGNLEVPDNIISSWWDI